MLESVVVGVFVLDLLSVQSVILVDYKMETAMQEQLIQQLVHVFVQIIGEENVVLGADLLIQIVEGIKDQITIPVDVIVFLLGLDLLVKFAH
jgi:hypothetical protein